MLRRRRARLLPVSAAGSDTDALQTDVMRFMAIIGLCLMAVFALVQGIPAPEQGKPVQLAQAARIREEARLLQQQLRQLQDEVRTLQLEKGQAGKLLQLARQQLDQVSGQARASRATLESRLQQLQRELEQGDRLLEDVKQRSRQQQQDLDALRRQLQSTQTLLDRSRREIEVLEEQQQDRKTGPVEPAAKPVPEPVTKPVSVQQGFTLRFASDAALDRLVAAGSVILFGMINQDAWRLSMQAGAAVAVRTSFPDWFHEMSVATVPVHYIRSLATVAKGVTSSSVVWGVQLPPATRSAVASLMQQRQGGVLVIRDDGQVGLEE